MTKKSQKSKSIKAPEKQLDFVNFKYALNLIGKKIYGDEWLFENYLDNSTPMDAARYVKTLRTFELLIKYHFFKVEKINGQKISPDEQVTFIIDGKKVTEEYRVLKDQLDYVLKTSRRFCDQAATKFAKPLIYRALFTPNVDEVERKFNKQEIAKIKEQVIIKDFGYWVQQNDLKIDQVYLVMLGINPEYYDFLSPEERQAVDHNCLFANYEKINLQLSHIEFFIGEFKHLGWENDWKKLIKDLYIKSPIISSTFASSCHRFIKYLDDQKLLPNCYDQYLNHDLYRPNYDECFKREKELEHEGVAFLALGLEPKYAKQFLEYMDVINTDYQKRYSVLGDDEKVFFYKCYRSFLDENLIFIGNKDTIIKHSTYEGNLENFADELHNKGFLLNEHFGEYLKRKKKFPDYNTDSKLYRILSFCSQMRYWNFDDIYNLVMDKDPISKAQIIFPLGRQCSDSFNVYKVDDKQSTYSIRLKTGEFCNIKTLDQFYSKEGEGYRPQDVLEWLIKHTFVGIPDLLTKLTFENSKNAKDKRKLTGLKKIIKSNKIEVAKTGRPTTIDYPKVWKIFIMEILEGKFDDNNLNYAQQAKIAFDNLEEAKQNKLCRDGKSNLAQNILFQCQDNEVEIGKTMITDKVVFAFEAEYIILQIALKRLT